MATDHYGSDLKIGDIVQKIGWSDQFTIIDIKSTWGSELITLQGQTYNEDRVHPTNLIKIG